MTQWTFSLVTRDAWESLRSDIAAARTSIEIEHYILADDEAGRPFLDLLCQKAKEGVKVRMMLDKVGSRSVFYSKWPKYLSEAGVELRFFNPVRWWSLFFPRRWFPRSHVKLALIDNEISHLGSDCIEKSMADWRDTHLRLEGILSGDIAGGFKRLWKSSFNAEYASAEGPFRFIAGKPSRNFFYKDILKAVDWSDRKIDLAGPYIMPSRKLIRYLKLAVKRGVEVRLIVTGPTDVLIADCVAHSYFHTLLRAGIKVFIYQPTVLHAKYAIIDNKWATVGSLNFDYLSFFQNREANIISTDPEFIAELESHAETDLATCTPYTMKEWRSRPLLYKIIGFLGRPLKRVL